MVVGSGSARSSTTRLVTFVNDKKATRPCPCGHRGSVLNACRCTPDLVARYQNRLSGPLLDRIDLQVEVPALPAQVLAALPDGEASEVVAARVARSRATAMARQGCPNAQLAGAALEAHATLDAAAAAFLQAAATRLGWSARGFHRVLRVARTIADLADLADLADGTGLADGAPIVTAHLAEAIQYRRVLAAA